MKNIVTIGMVTILCLMLFSACGNSKTESKATTEDILVQSHTATTLEPSAGGVYTGDTRISEVINDAVAFWEEQVGK